jgi:hypothetical protein
MNFFRIVLIPILNVINHETVIFISTVLNHGSWHSTVGIATDYRLDGQGTRNQAQLEASFFLSLHVAQTSSGAHPASYPISAGGFSSG